MCMFFIIAWSIFNCCSYRACGPFFVNVVVARAVSGLMMFVLMVLRGISTF